MSEATQRVVASCIGTVLLVWPATHAAAEFHVSVNGNDRNDGSASKPYKNLIAGDWFIDQGRPHHNGEVYLNGKSLLALNAGGCP